VHLLATQAARCGPDKGHTAFSVQFDTNLKETLVFALASWLHDCVPARPVKPDGAQGDDDRLSESDARALDEELKCLGSTTPGEWGTLGAPRQYYGMHSMLERAALDCSYRAPGTYVTLEPYRFVFCPEDQLKFEKKREAVPQLLRSFVVPLHEVGCPVRDEEDEQDLEKVTRFPLDFRGPVAGCTCFRSKNICSNINDEKVRADPQARAIALFRERSASDAVMPPLMAGVGRWSYPSDALGEALKVADVPLHATRDANEAELDVLEEYLSGFHL